MSVPADIISVPLDGFSLGPSPQGDHGQDTNGPPDWTAAIQRQIQWILFAALELVWPHPQRE